MDVCMCRTPERDFKEQVPIQEWHEKKAFSLCFRPTAVTGLEELRNSNFPGCLCNQRCTDQTFNSHFVSWINPQDRLSKIQRVCVHHMEHLNYSLLCQKFRLRKQWEDMIVALEHPYKNHSSQKGPEVAKNLSASMTRAETTLEKYSMHSLRLRHCFPKSKYSNKMKQVACSADGGDSFLSASYQHCSDFSVNLSHILSFRPDWLCPEEILHSTKMLKREQARSQSKPCNGLCQDEGAPKGRWGKWCNLSVLGHKGGWYALLKAVHIPQNIKGDCKQGTAMFPAL